MEHTTGAGWEVRLATRDDAAELGRIHAESFRETYTGLLPEEFVAEWSDPALREAQWSARLEKGKQPIFLGLLDGDSVGVACAGPSRDPEPVRELELQVIYLLRVAHGTGLGNALLTAAIGDAPASLWVLDSNARAIAFYRRHGFEPEEPPVMRPRPPANDLRLVR